METSTSVLVFAPEAPGNPQIEHDKRPSHLTVDRSHGKSRGAESPPHGRRHRQKGANGELETAVTPRKKNRGTKDHSEPRASAKDKTRNVGRREQTPNRGRPHPLVQWVRESMPGNIRERKMNDL
jgi:hypothetical protein